MPQPLFPNAPDPGPAPPGGPRHLWIEPTTHCNTLCRHCGRYGTDFQGRHMERPLYERIRDELLDGAQEAGLIGFGEPLMAPLFDEMLEDCERRGIETYIATNGKLLRRRELCARLVRANMRIVVSVDGARPESFEFVRPHISWERMLEALECLREESEAAGPERRCRIAFNFVPMKRNVDDLPELVRLAKRFGAGQIVLFPLSKEENAPEEMRDQSLRDSPELLRGPLEEALALGRELGVDLSVPASFHEALLTAHTRGNGLLAGLLGRLDAGWTYLRLRGPRRLARGLRRRLAPGSKAGFSRCHHPWRSSYLAVDGRVHPCCIVGDIMGNLTRQSWEEIWNGLPYTSLRRTIHGWNPSQMCRYCSLPDGINGGNHWQHQRYFERFRVEEMPIDDVRVDWGEGCYPVECDAEGRPTHHWLERRARLRLRPGPGRPRFLRLTVVPRSPVMPFSGGALRIDGGAPEYFDNSCPQLHFPLPRGRELDLEIRMDQDGHPDGDPRPLALCVRGLALLHRR